eukprot:TRINITY_DN6242_c0_g1_i5.p1 TRINITY_DN6242_c0_g1~~TRINITY_DN6242_c0_g1_i5.p1  ORF type:complete len:129 (+),score=33.09 TRINITY_DN6242_c0_g1_i5:69-455(+)
MGCGPSSSRKLTPELRDKVLAVFRKIDVNDSKTIDREETMKLWKSNFAKLNTEALFKAVDKDKNGNISEEEWLHFWEAVKKAGHTEEEIEEELKNLNEGKAWVYFDKVPTEIGKQNTGDSARRRKVVD